MTMSVLSDKHPVIALVVPCYNEEAVLPHTLKDLSAYLSELAERGAISEKSFIYFIDCLLYTSDAADE